MRAPTRAVAQLAAIAILATFAILAVPASSQAATVPGGMFGMQDWKPPSAAMMVPVASAGIQRWRAPMYWYKVEPKPPEAGQHAYDWSAYDRAVTDAATSNMPLLAILLGCPVWACADKVGPPRTDAGIAAQDAFVDAAVRRYGTQGTFWDEHTELPRQPVTEWQVGNEVNYPGYWTPAPSAAEYASLLRREGAVIKAADPGATVVLSGLSDVRPADAAGFLSQLYEQPDFKSSFDVMAVHAYASDVHGVADLLDTIRGVEDRNDDSDRHMWMTEIGWGTSTTKLHTPTTEAQQATRMRQSFDMAIGCSARWNLDRVYWFAYSDITPAAAGAKLDSAGFHTGLIDVAGRQKPAWAALQEYGTGKSLLPAGRGDECVIPDREPIPAAAPAAAASSARPAGVPVGGFGQWTASSSRGAPQTLIFARTRLRNTRRAKMAFASGGPARFQCRLLRGRTGKRWRGCSRRYRSTRLRRGRYRLQVRAIDVAGVKDPTPAEARLRLTGRRLTIATRTR